MPQLKPLSLKLLYFAVGLLPLIGLALISQQDLENNPRKLLWFGLLGGILMASIMIQNKLRKMGILRFKEIGTYAALFIITTIFILIIRQIL